MAKLNYFTFKNDKDLMSDEMVNNAIDRLRKRWKRIADYHAEHNRETICSKCNNEEFDYHHNRSVCTKCGNEEEKEISHQDAVKLGCATRTLSGCLRELMGSELAAKAKKQKLSKNELRELNFSLEEFNDLEFTDAEREFLNRRFAELLDEVGGRANRVDMFQTYQLAVQELKIMNMNRLSNFEDVDVMDRKREMDIYRNLISDLKAAKSKRDDVKDKTVMQDLAEKAKALNLDEKIKEHVDYLNGEYKEYLEEAKERKKSVGNKF